MQHDKNIRVAIIEDHPDFREGLAHLITMSPQFACVGKYSSVEEAKKNFPECDVLLLDIHLPGVSGIQGIPFFKRHFSQMKILMLTVFDDDENVFDSILAGADGYLLKRTPPPKILEAIRDVLEEGSPMTPFIARKVIEFFKKKGSKKPDYELTRREEEILAELVKGIDSKQIANNLFISYDTVRNHLKNIYEKLHVHSRTEAVSKALREGLIK